MKSITGQGKTTWNRGFKKKLDSSGAYNVLKDDMRLLEECIQQQIDSELVPSGAKSGVFLNQDCEQLPSFWPVAPIEKVISRVDNGSRHRGARIVLTKDNYGSRRTGVGGKGGTMCEAIDIVAGTLSCERRLSTSLTETRANFVSDGARIYLTERGDLQHYFCLGDGSKATSITSALKSGIGIKADHTLVIGRERVRILVGLSKALGRESLVNNNSNVTPKIEIASIGDDNAQPAVLGDNLISYLKEMNEEMQELRNRIQDVQKNLVEYKTAMALHTHNGAGIGVVQIFPSPESAKEGLQSIPEFFNTTFDNIVKTYRALIKEWRAMGSDVGVKGSLDKRLLSSTVYIGM